MKVVLFHEIADPESAAVRKWVMDRGLKEKIDFRNAHYDEVSADLIKILGRRQTPVLVVEEECVAIGYDDIVKWLTANKIV